MIRKSHLLLALALVAAAVAAPIAQADSAPKVDPLAVSYLMGRGLSPDQVKSWTVGDCSQPTRDAACYAMFKPTGTVSTQVDPSTGFQWGDAGIGAGFTLGIVLLLGGIGAGLLVSRQSRRRQPARA